MCASSGKSGHCRGRAASHDGVRHDIRGKRNWLECLQRSPIRRPAGRRPALATPDACRTLDWHAQGGCVCSGMHASWGVHAGRDATGSERRLPLPQHLDSGKDRARAPASDRLDIRRRIHQRVGLDALVLGRPARAKRCHRCHHRLSPRSAWFSCAS